MYQHFDTAKSLPGLRIRSFIASDKSYDYARFLIIYQGGYIK